MKRPEDAPIHGKDVLILADFNVTITEGRPSCAFKIDQALPTVEHVLASGCRSLTIASHLGRPQNRHEFSMKPVYDYLATKIAGVKYKCIADYLINGRCLSSANTVQLTDNLRYYSDEELERFHSLFDTIINDAFGSAHRPVHVHAYPGLLMVKEIENLSRARQADLVIMGGAKIKDKLCIMEHFTGVVYLGGCLATTVLRSLGYEVGKYSKAEECDCSGLAGRIVSVADAGDIVRKKSEDIMAGRPVGTRDIPRESTRSSTTGLDCKEPVDTFIEPAASSSQEPVRLHSARGGAVLNADSDAADPEQASPAIPLKEDHELPPAGECKKARLKIVLPVDFFVIEHSGNARHCRIKRYDAVAQDDECIDVGPESMEQLKMLIGGSTSIFWNGPLGKMEMPEANSTGILISTLESCKASTFLGGGETLESVIKYSDIQKFTHISTGGGAMLQYLSGEEMPGISALLQ